jgi:uncharacterized protein YjiS (DUF1127 family)
MWTFVYIALQRFTATLATERRVRRAIRELKALDDHRLRDLGLTRRTLERVVRFGRDRDADAARPAGARDRADPARAHDHPKRRR